MTGYLTTHTGQLWQLPPLLSWEILRTDGDGCDAALVRFLYEPERLDVLKSACRLRLEEDGKTLFSGVVDEAAASLSEKGRIATLSCRGLQALLMDNQLRATRFQTLELSDALDHFVRPFGISKICPVPMPAVENFAVETGNTAWQALQGFCRHSGGGSPRFSADGTLLFGPESGSLLHLEDDRAVTAAELRRCAYGVISRQVVVSSGYEDLEIAENPDFLSRGGSSQKVNMHQGRSTKADWRTAGQRVTESAREEFTLTVTVAGQFPALPGDRVRVMLKNAGFAGTFLLRSLKWEQSAAGRQTTLTLEGDGSNVDV